ncbi:glycosyltransferase [Halomonas elongata]|uniref:glycosyltransferase n=1 Tax=Halomonas elongata TaxID=2746 RepID=UPI00186B9A6C|nr:glycosyltransferase [Halomonas elongata]MBW5800350.1 glycosyltransferase [Halomonas elongata]
MKHACPVSSHAAGSDREPIDEKTLFEKAGRLINNRAARFYRFFLPRRGTSVSQSNTSSHVPESPLSILFIMDHLDTGGAPIVVRNLIKEMSAQGVRVTLLLLSSRPRHELPDDVLTIDVPFAPTSLYQRLRRYHLHAKKIEATLESAPVRERGPFDLVMAHLHHAHQVVSRTSLAQTSWYCLHSDPVSAFLGNKRGLARRIKKYKVKRLYHGRKLVTVSKEMLNRLSAHFGIHPEKGVSILNPLDIEHIQQLAHQSVSDIADDEFLVFVGRLDLRAKRFDRLLEAYRQSGTELPLLIIGGGSSSEQVARLIRDMGLEDRVRMLGHRDNPYPYMARSRALLLSSDYEGFALVLAEALSLGVPVISTNCPCGPAEILGNSLKDCLVPVDDTAAFARAISRVIAAPPAIPHDICDNFQLATVARRYTSLTQA